MKQISYIIIATLMSISATSQVGKEDIHQKLISMGLDSSKLNSNQFSKQLIIAWTKADHESNKYNPYIILPINIWEVLFENQYNKSNEIIQKAQLAISYSTILIDLSKYEKAIPILENAYLSRKKISKSYYNVLLSNLESCYKSKNELSSSSYITCNDW